MAVREDALNPPSFTLRQKLWQMHWLFILLLGATASVGFAMLYSAAGGNIDPWASRQMVRFAVGMAVLRRMQPHSRALQHMASHARSSQRPRTRQSGERRPRAPPTARGAAQTTSNW